MTDFVVAANDRLAQLAIFLGYAPVSDSRPTSPLPLRTLVEQAFAGMRREIFGTLPNVAPTARPVQLYQFDTGETVGDLLPFDLNGDPLTYRVTQDAAHGEVIVNANGTYLYVPDRDFAVTGGTDTFAVTLDDGRLAAGASPTSVQVSVNIAPTLGRDRGFDINNRYPGNMTLVSYGQDKEAFVSGPAGGTVIGLGGSARVDVAQYLLVDKVLSVSLTSAADATYTVHLKTVGTANTGEPETWCEHSSGAGCTDRGTRQNIDLFAANPSTITYGPGQAQQQSEVLLNLCNSGNFQCNFTPTSQEYTATNRHLVGTYINDGDADLPVKRTRKETVTQSDGLSIGGDISANLLKIINVAINAKYHHDWTSTREISTALDYIVKPGKKLQIYLSNPVVRVHGDFTVVDGKTTFVLKDVYFDTPDPSGEGVVEYVVRPLTAEDLGEASATATGLTTTAV